MPHKRIAEIKQEREFHNQPVSKSDRCLYPNGKNKLLLFIQWTVAADIVRRLEKIREMNKPNSPNEEWNDAFCMAIQKLPEARDFEKDCWWNYYTYRGTQND